MKENADPAWCTSARDLFWERIAIMREANNIPDIIQTPNEIIYVATCQAEAEQRAFECSEIKM